VAADAGAEALLAESAAEVAGLAADEETPPAEFEEAAEVAEAESGDLRERMAATLCGPPNHSNSDTQSARKG
jgi:hypothetical protein